MKGYKISQNGYVAWLQAWMEDKPQEEYKLTESFCSVFWSTIFGTIMLIPFGPATLLLRCFKYTRTTKFGMKFSGFITMGLLVLFMTIFAVITKGWFVLINLLLTLLGSALTIFLLGAMVHFATVGGDKYRDWKFSRMSQEELEEYFRKKDERRQKQEERDEKRKNKQPNFLVLGWRTFMDRYCPKVTWTNS